MKWDSTLGLHLLVLILLGWFIFPLMALSWKRWSRSEWLLFSFVALYFVSLWLPQVSGWCRFYLPLVPVLLLLSAKGVVRLGEVVKPVNIATGVSFVLVVNAAALWCDLYW